MTQFGPKHESSCMGVKSNRILLSHEGNTIHTGTAIRLLEGMTMLAISLVVYVVISSVVCTGTS